MDGPKDESRAAVLLEHIGCRFPCSTTSYLRQSFPGGVLKNGISVGCRDVALMTLSMVELPKMPIRTDSFSVQRPRTTALTGTNHLR